MSINSLAVWFLSAALCYVVVLLTAIVVQAVRSREEESPEFSEAKFFLWCLLKNGYDGEIVLFRDTRKRRFIRFEKYIDNGDATDLLKKYLKPKKNKEDG